MLVGASCKRLPFHCHDSLCQLASQTFEANPQGALLTQPDNSLGLGSVDDYKANALPELCQGGGCVFGIEVIVSSRVAVQARLPVGQGHLNDMIPAC